MVAVLPVVPAWIDNYSKLLKEDLADAGLKPSAYM
jgi:hypothetical protein